MYDFWKVGMDQITFIPTHQSRYMYWCSILQELQIFEPGNSKKIEEAKANCVAFASLLN